MPRGITRRAAARLVVIGPAVLAFRDAVRAEPAIPKAARKPAFSAAERREIEKAVAQLRSTAEKVRKVGIPMGSEPAFVFRPLLPKK